MRLSRAVRASVTALLVTGCAHAATTAPPIPAGEQARDDLIKSAQRVLVTRCLDGKGLSLPATQAPRPETPEDKRVQAAVFGNDPRELSITLPTGHTVTANTDGCLADAQRALYGDPKAWFEADVIVNNLRAEARARMTTDADHRAAVARRTHCVEQSSSGIRQPRQQDRAVAERCDRESGLLEVEARLEPALLAKVRDERRDQVDVHKHLRMVALRRAQSLAGAATTPLAGPVDRPADRRDRVTDTHTKQQEPKGHPLR
ncbi:hypothetical protein [Streptomyces sp. NPDC091268]|uniref:hypothetical protein n=1 Tax=Streptomyces sp. NPDC091268 TaxID=3365979 RepID=UPI0037FEAAEB